MKKKQEQQSDGKQAFSWAVPPDLGIPPDPLRLRLDFFHQAVQMTFFSDEKIETKIVSALDIAHALANELSFNTGLLPDNTLWWRNTRSGPEYALYEKPDIHKLAVQLDPNKPAERLTVPLPGFIFLCKPAMPPWVYAVKNKPTKETDLVYKAPLLNIFTDGRSCPGSHRYPERVQDIVSSFFVSFFSDTADVRDRSIQCPDSILKLWHLLNGKKEFPIDDLIKHGTIYDLMNMRMD